MRRFAHNRAAMGGLVFVLLLVVVALAAPHLAPRNPFALSEMLLRPPGPGHPLGTDDLGRDVLSMLIFGTRVSLTVGFLAAAAATLIGIVVGTLAGYYGGLADLLLMRVSELFQVIPSFILAALIVALWGPGLSRVVVVIAILAWPQTARLIRSQVLSLREREFVDAVRCLGVSDLRIMMGEIVPNALAPVIAVGALIVGQAITLAAGLSFLGLSSPNAMSWGKVLNVGQRFLFNGWWLSVFSGLAIFFTVLAFNLLGDGINDALNPRTKQA